MFYFDPMYLVFLAPGLLLSMYAAWKTKSTFTWYKNKGTSSQLSGAEVALSILRDNNISNVRVEPIEGFLSDHYDPRGKVLRLSPDVYHGRSMAAFGVAAHEVGHAIQDAAGYGPLKIRSGIVPFVNFASPISMYLIMGSMIMGGAATALGYQLAWGGLILFGAGTLFTLVTLPVEFDASKRALVCLQRGSYVSPEELRGAKKVLNAAALTYVAAAVTSLLMLVYYAFRLGLLGGGGRDRE